MNKLSNPMAISVCITTRSMGLGTAAIFRDIYQNNSYVLEKIRLHMSIYELYRVSLASLEYKVGYVRKEEPVIITSCENHYYELKMSPSCYHHDMVSAKLPSELLVAIEAIGVVQTGGKTYLPRLGRSNFTIGGLFIPQAEQVVLTNLRETVVALSSPRTPVQYRRRFYENNPIPGCIWKDASDNPILQNIDEIMPASYSSTDLSNDISKLQFHTLGRKLEQYKAKILPLKVQGSKAMLVSNKQGSLRITDLRDGEALEDYYKRIAVEGNIGHYHSLVVVNGTELAVGAVSLLGEMPNVQELINPVYIMRDERVAVQYCNTNYKSAHLRLYSIFCRQ